MKTVIVWTDELRAKFKREYLKHRADGKPSEFEFTVKLAGQDCKWTMAYAKYTVDFHDRKYPPGRVVEPPVEEEEDEPSPPPQPVVRKRRPLAQPIEPAPPPTPPVPEEQIGEFFDDGFDE